MRGHGDHRRAATQHRSHVPAMWGAYLDAALGQIYGSADGRGKVTIIAIDPGPEQSAYVVTNGRNINQRAKVDNEDLLEILRSHSADVVQAAVCERIRSFGMPVGAEIFATCEWCGRFQQQWAAHELNWATRNDTWHWITRNEEKLNLCGTPRAKDANIRQAIIDRFGGKDKAIGTKKAPGPLYGISGDCWSALAVALTWLDLNRVEGVA